MTSAELAELDRGVPGSLGSLGWLNSRVLDDLIDFFDAQAQRRRQQRWDLTKEALAQLRQIVGEETITTAKGLFCIAQTIDAQYASESITAAERDWLVGKGVVRPAPAFFNDARNSPPPIGQMTPVAIARRWFRSLWPVPDLGGARSFVRLPEPRPVLLPATSRARLQNARERGVLRVALVTWRRHDAAGLIIKRPADGCFAVEGLGRAPPADLAQRLVATLVERRIDVAVLPEIALDPADRTSLQQALDRAEASHPVLLIAGLAHRMGAAHYVNEALVVDSRGREIFRHEKIEPFTDDSFGLEAITPREMTTYSFLETPVGRLVVNICRDVRSDVASVLNRALDATMLVVPAYSSRLDFVAGEAPVLGQRQRAVTISVNPAIVGTKLRDAGYLYCPIRGKEHAAGTTLSQESIGKDGDVSVHIFTLGVDRTLHATMQGPENMVL